MSEPLRLFDVGNEKLPALLPTPTSKGAGERSSAKPRSPERRAPFFAAGWNGDEDSPITCADCRLDCFVGLPATELRRAEVAHIDPCDQRWFSTRAGWSNVTVCCRACNKAQADSDLRRFGIPALRVTREHVLASVEEFNARSARLSVEQESRDRARDHARSLRLPPR